jgi:hypothetical protein
MGPVEYKILRGDEDGDKMFLWLFAKMGQGFFPLGQGWGSNPQRGIPRCHLYSTNTIPGEKVELGVTFMVF